MISFFCIVLEEFVTSFENEKGKASGQQHDARCGETGCEQRDLEHGIVDKETGEASAAAQRVD